MGRWVWMCFALLGLIKGSSCVLCGEVTEPCYLYNTIEMPYLSTRHPDIELTVETATEQYCDLFAINPNTWYRSDYNMTTRVVEQGKCGTNYPIWLNGTIPDSADGVVTRDACVKTFEGDCSTTYTVEMRNCQYYTVYCFPNVPSSCHQRYCFDVDLTATTTTPTAATTTQLTVPDPQCPVCPAEESQNGKDLSKNSLAAVLVTLCACIVVFGVVMVVVLYVIRRKVCPERKYAVPCNTTRMDVDQQPNQIHQPNPRDYKAKSHTVQTKMQPKFISYGDSLPPPYGE